MERVERRTRQLLGDFPLGDSEWFMKRTDPTTSRRRPEFGLLTEICIADTEFRDRAFVVERLFVLYGASHAAMEEPALRSLLELDG